MKQADRIVAWGMSWGMLWALPLLLGLGGPAGATASLTCSAKDRNLTFELLGNLGRGDGATVQLIGGEIKVAARPGKYGTLEFKIGPEAIASAWSFGKELRIGIKPEDSGEVSAFLAIIGEEAKGKPDDLTRWRGVYVLKLAGPKGEAEIKGRLKGCDAG